MKRERRQHTQVSLTNRVHAHRRGGAHVDYDKEREVQHMTTEKTLAEHARDKTGPYDLTRMPGGFVDFSNGGGSLKGNFKKGALVEWGDATSGTVGYGLVVELDLQNQQANVQPLSLNADGQLTADSSRRIMKDIDVLRPSSKQLAPDYVGGYSNGVKKTGPTHAAADFSEFKRRWKAIVGTDFSR
jgi:hypothetical protein